jgi:RNA polymerase sigma-70 factor (ECF subfamily)
MTDPPATRHSLLVRIRDVRDAEAWAQFVDVYAPLVYRFARRRGLQDADAADLTQEVLRAVARSARRLKYDPKRGTFRSWLFTVAVNKLRNFLASRKRQPQATGDSSDFRRLDEQPAAESDEAEWDRAYDQRIFAWAAEQVRGSFEDSTWQAFSATAVEGRSPKEVAAELGLSVGAVYIAKSRVIARLKAQIRQLRCNEGS